MRIEQRVALVDERPRIHIAQRDDARKRRAHGLVCQKIVEPRHVRLHRGSIVSRRRHGLFERIHVGLLGSPLRLVGVVLLARNHALLGQVLQRWAVTRARFSLLWPC